MAPVSPAGRKVVLEKAWEGRGGLAGPRSNMRLNHSQGGEEKSLRQAMPWAQASLSQ